MASVDLDVALPVIFSFLKQNPTFKKTAKRFQKDAAEYDLENKTGEDLLQLIGCGRIYLEQQKSIQESQKEKKESKRKRKEIEEQSNKKQKTEDGDVAGKSQEEPVLSKKEKKKKKKAKVQNVSESDAKDKADALANQEIEITPQSDEVNDTSNVDPSSNAEHADGKHKKKKKSLTPNKPFKRIDEENVPLINESLKDGSWTKEVDQWGHKANQDLQVVKGRSFRHAKTKKKRGTYKGGEIDMGVHSFKFDNSDDE